MTNPSCSAELANGGTCGIAASRRCERCESPLCESHKPQAFLGHLLCVFCRDEALAANRCQWDEGGTNWCPKASSTVCQSCGRRICENHEMTERQGVPIGYGQFSGTIVEYRSARTGTCLSCHGERVARNTAATEEHFELHTTRVLHGKAQGWMFEAGVPLTEFVEIEKRETHPYPARRSPLGTGMPSPRTLGRPRSRALDQAGTWAYTQSGDSALQRTAKLPTKLRPTFT